MTCFSNVLKIQCAGRRHGENLNKVKAWKLTRVPVTRASSAVFFWGWTSSSGATLRPLQSFKDKVDMGGVYHILQKHASSILYPVQGELLATGETLTFFSFFFFGCASRHEDVSSQIRIEPMPSSAEKSYSFRIAKEVPRGHSLLMLVYHMSNRSGIKYAEQFT